MKFMEEVREEWIEAWQKVKPDYDKSFYEDIASLDNKAFLKLMGRYIKKGKLVLEAGCGYGHKCVLFSKYFKGEVVGVDIVSYPLKALKEYLDFSTKDLWIFVCNCDVTRLPFRDGIFDIVTSFGVLEHFRSYLEVNCALSEARRVLRNGGYLILVIPNFAATFRNRLIIALTKGRFGMYHKLYTKGQLVRHIEVIKGLQLVEVGFLPFGFRSLILGMVKGLSLEKLIYFFYHAVWRMLNLVLRVIGDEYQSPIYIVAKRIGNVECYCHLWH